MPTSKPIKKAGVASKKSLAVKTGTAKTSGVAKTPATAKKGTAIKKFAKLGALGAVSTAQVLAALWDKTLRPKDGVQALARIGDSVTADRKTFDGVIRVLLDSENDGAVRGEALSTLQGATFDTRNFARYRPAYLKALRALRSDDDSELRQRAFGLLAREQDADTQGVLIAGLEDPGQALLPPEKALQLLSYDPHAGAYGVARKIEQEPPNPLARREALRVLAGDSNSVKLFERVLEDKTESTEVRQLAASALNHLAPNRMYALARDRALDAGESEEMKTVCLTALANFGDPKALLQDKELQEQVDRYQGSSAGKTTPLEAAAASFKRRYK